MSSPFFLSAPKLRELGYSVVPLHPKSKRPAIEKWTEFGIDLADEETFQRWMKWKDCNIGVCLGVASNLVAIDLDNDIGGLHAQIESMLPKTQVCKIGAKGKTLFFQYNGQKSQGYSKDSERVLDILSQGRQTVLPPSIHPSGSVYKWVGDRTLLNTSAKDLPHISLHTVYEIGKIFVPEPHQVSNPRQVMVYDDTRLTEVIEALTYVSSDDYDLWIRIGMGLKDKFGEEAFSIWDQWSSTSTKYNNREIRTKWTSFHGQGITIASLFYHAMDNGYSNMPADYFLDEIKIDFELNGRRTGSSPLPLTATSIQINTAPRAVAAAPKTELIAAAVGQSPLPSRKTDAMIFPSKLLDAPGLPGQLLGFINKTSLVPQPVLAIGASIAAAGALMGRKVRAETNIRTNFYIIGLAPSGSGKDHARTIIKRLLHDNGLGHLELGVPASSAGLVSGLRDRGQGRGIILWDEFGRVLKQISSWKAGGHEKDIVTALIELFSSSQSVYMGKQYANHDGKAPMKPIDQPCLTVYGTSVPSHFYDALSGGEAIDGFLARWLIFESKDYTMEEINHDDILAEIPESLMEICQYWKDHPFSNDGLGGNMSDIAKASPRLVKCTPAAAAYLNDFATEMRKLAMQHELSGDSGGSAIWSRAAEHARRLALVACEGDVIELNVVEWAVALARYCCQYMASAIEDYVSSSELESQTKRVLRLIKEKTKNPETWVTRADITKAFQGVQMRTRMEILGSLIERGEISEHKSPGSLGRPTLKYRAI